MKDTFETRIYLIFFHFSIILTVFKNKKINFSQQNYDNLFNCIENDLRELGFGDVSVNKKMKNMNLLKQTYHHASIDTKKIFDQIKIYSSIPQLKLNFF